MDEIDWEGMTPEKLSELLNNYSGEKRKKIISILMEKTSIVSLLNIKSFLDQYDPTCPVDSILCSMAAEVLRRTGDHIYEDSKGKTVLSGMEVMQSSINALEELIESIKEKQILMEVEIAKDECKH